MFTNICETKSWMKLNITIEVKNSGEKYVAENKLRPFKFVVVVSKKYNEFSLSNGLFETRIQTMRFIHEFFVFLAVSLAKLQLSFSKLSAFISEYLATLF